MIMVPNIKLPGFFELLTPRGPWPSWKRTRAIFFKSDASNKRQHLKNPAGIWNSVIERSYIKHTEHPKSSAQSHVCRVTHICTCPVLWKLQWIIPRSRSFDTGCHFNLHGSSLIPAWICNYTHFNVWDEITYLFLDFNGATIYLVVGRQIINHWNQTAFTVFREGKHMTPPRNYILPISV